jgi:tetratricopeptide (TPR) repeat protein
MISCQTQAALLRRPDIHIGEIYGLLPGDLSSSQFFQQIQPEDDLPERLIYQMADSISRHNGNDVAKYWFDKLSKRFARIASDPVYLQALKGSCYARDAMRGDDVAPLPPNQAAKSQEERFATAVAELEKAYSMDRTLPMVPREMLLILLWHGADHEQINRWYARALEINPDDYAVCRLILDNLPLEEKLAFGRKCLEGQNWRGRLPLILVGAHEAKGDAADEKNEYWHRPDVWKEVRQVYETYLEYFPRDVEERSRYALLANRCSQWAEADRQFNILGDKPSLRVFGSMTSYNYQRKKAAKNLGTTPTDGGK